MYYGEKLNSISHLVGAIFALIALGALLALGIQSSEPLTIIGYSTFGLSMVLLYTMSTLYHSFETPELKRAFQVWDHIAIYLLIACTYTPLMLISVGSDSGTKILGLVWGLAFLGIITEILLSGRIVKIGQLIIYLGMGWACSLDLATLRTALGNEGFLWLATGGVAYTAGVAFYVMDKVKWLNHAHGIWHVFVLAGSLCHFITVIGYVK